MSDKLSDANEGWIRQARQRITNEIASVHLHLFTSDLKDSLCGRVRFHLNELRGKLYPTPHGTPNVRVVEVPPPEWHTDSFIRNSVIARSGHFDIVLSAHPVVAAQWRRLGVAVQEDDDE